MADSPVQIYENAGERQGQPQSSRPEPHDGLHPVHEFAAVTDRVILDPNAENAVQVPEGVGATTAGHASPLAEALKAGTPEEQFSTADAPSEEDETLTGPETAEEEQTEAS